jgi:hypothetical protein
LLSEGLNEKSTRPKAGTIVLRAGTGLAVLTASYYGLGVEPAQWLFAIAVMLLGLFEHLLR